jgi:hypothetical protein
LFSLPPAAFRAGVELSIRLTMMTPGFAVSSRTASVIGILGRTEGIMDHFEKFGFAIMVVFGAIIIGGLMAYGIAWEDKPAFLYSLAAAVAVWGSSFAVVFDRPRIFGGLLVIAIVLITLSVTAIVS